ncbi:MAG: cyclic nucleotide-binding domain-containing protein [Oscillospiraceae bacterium]|nr:cyclic nucleotide-binding domain-containing protein [Oscillospiraceae bacterium]
MEQKHFAENEMIFRQGDPSDCMYRIESGSVGIFLDYEGGGQRKLTELSAGQFLGEMGLLDRLPRSATAVSLSDDTALRVIDEASFQRFTAEEPEKILPLLEQMSVRLRRISRDYAEACRTVDLVMEAEKAGKPRDAALTNRVAKTLAGYEASRLEEQDGGKDA